jgi:hypothetical protein
MALVKKNSGNTRALCGDMLKTDNVTGVWMSVVKGEGKKDVIRPTVEYQCVNSLGFVQDQSKKMIGVGYN